MNYGPRIAECESMKVVFSQAKIVELKIVCLGKMYSMNDIDPQLSAALCALIMREQEAQIEKMKKSKGELT